MRTFRSLITTAALATCPFIAATAGHAQTASPATPDADPPRTTDAPTQPSEDIVVTGIKASLGKALSIKRNSVQLVDVISAEDIGKLPDPTIADALQRVSGVQIIRTFGEGNKVNIRGLSNVRIEVDGRSNLGISLAESLGEGGGRNGGLEQLSSTLFSRLEVFKTPTAGQVEGGLGGVINAHTPKPFEFNKPTFAFSADGNYGDGAKSFGFALSGLATTRLFGDALGVLLNVSYEARTLGTQTIARGVYNDATTDLSGDGVLDVRPSQLRGEFFRVDRKRLGIVSNVTLRPAPDLELFVDANYSKLETDRNTLQTFINIGNAAITAPKFDGNFLVGGTISTPFVIGGIQRNEPTDNLLVAGGGSYKSGIFHVKGEVAYSRGRENPGYQTAYQVRTKTPVVANFDFTTKDVPSLTIVSGPDLTNVANFENATLLRDRRYYQNAEKSARIDTQFDVGGGVLSDIRLGGRYAEIQSSRVSFSTTASGVVAPSTLPAEFFGTQDWALFPQFPGRWPQQFIRPYPLADGDRSALLTPSTDPAPLNTEYYNLVEKTWAGYAEANFKGDLFSLPFQANAGLRVIRTDLSVDTFLRTVTGATFVDKPVTDKSGYTDFLPSANIKLNLSDDLLLRFSAARIMSRQDFASLAPAVNIRISPPLATGGNAALKPTRVNQYDAALEWYFAPSSLLSGAVFYKDASGFVASETTFQVFPGFESLGSIAYTRPVNAADATIKGFELNYQQTFTKLPGILSGLGFIANFTFADGKTKTGDPLTSLSRTSYNVTGFYEKKGFSARLAYSWRDKRLFSFTNGLTRRANYVSGTGSLDASLSYDLSKHFTVIASASNLLPKVGGFSNYSVVEDAIYGYDIYDRTFVIGVRGKF